MTRKLAPATALAILAACGASCSHNAITTPPPTGIQYFQIDGATCKGTEGTHAIKARVVDYVGGSADLWTVNNHVIMPGNGPAMVVIVC